MKKKLFILISSLWILATVLFVPLLKIYNDYYSIFKFICMVKESLYSMLFLLPILLSLTSIVLLIFGSKKESTLIISNIFLIASITLTMLSKSIADLIMGCGESDMIFASGFFLQLSYYFVLFLATNVTKNLEFNFSIQDIVEIAMFVAIALILDLSFLKIRIGQNGGSISLVMVPLIVICLRKGFIKGFIACGLVYGLLNCIMDGYGFFSYPFDYLFAFGLLAVVGLFRKQILSKNHKITFKGCLFLVIGLLLAFSCRLAMATLSGMIFYETPFVGSLTYNLAYIWPSALGTTVVIFLLYKPLLLIEKRFPSIKY